MTQTLTPAELIQKLNNLQASMVPAISKGMSQATGNVKAQAIKNCDPGHSPYEDMNFPTKVDYANKHGLSYTGAPYSYDSDKNRELVHMRDQMYSKTETTGTSVRGVVGNTSDHALAVHDGTSVMWARPFISDAIAEKQDETLAILSNAIEIAVMSQTEGGIWTGSSMFNGNVPTMPEDEGD